MKTRIYKKIEDVPASIWNTFLTGQSLAFGYEFWCAVEKSRMNDFDYHYVLLLDDNDSPVALTSFYSITTDVAIFAPLVLRNILLCIRHVFPGFLKFRMIEWGTPITVSSPPYVLSEHISQEEFVAHMHQLLMQRAKAEGQFLIVVRDFQGACTAAQASFAAHRYHLVDSLPNTALDIVWPSAASYHSAMKSYYRSKLLKHLRRNQDHDVRHELVDDFDHLADVLCHQWLVVHNQADEFQREVLTPTFYREFSRNLGDASKALLFYKSNALVGHALLLVDGSMLRWLYFGRDEAINDSLYLYVAHAVIETAISLKAQTLEMGLTTYPVKLDLGAQVRPIKIALRAVSGLINPFVGWGYRLLNRPPTVRARQVFK